MIGGDGEPFANVAHILDDRGPDHCRCGCFSHLNKKAAEMLSKPNRIGGRLVVRFVSKSTEFLSTMSHPNG